MDEIVDDVVVRVLALNHADAADAADEIERLRALVRELRPYMEVDMNSGLSVGPGPEYHYHPDNPVKRCSDCEWYEEAFAWKQRIEAGELDV